MILPYWGQLSIIYCFFIAIFLVFRICQTKYKQIHFFKMVREKQQNIYDRIPFTPFIVYLNKGSFVIVFAHSVDD